MTPANRITNGPQRNPLVQRLEERFGPLILQCQQATVLCQQLQLAGNLPVHFPRIVVVGCESAGKSSVIERLAGFRFFPIGQGLTTRMPISVSLKLTSEEECVQLCTKHRIAFNPDSGNPIIGLKPLNSQTMEYFVDNRAADRIQLEMTALLRAVNNGQAVGISEAEFEIEILHWTIPNLKFVDLPGVVSATRAEEPQDLPAKTLNLSRRYISDKNSLVIAVVPCMEYIVNNRIVGLIQECNAVDRTLCVLTKIDITVPIQSVISRVSSTSPDAGPFRNGFGNVGISNCGDERWEIWLKSP